MTRDRTPERLDAPEVPDESATGAVVGEIKTHRTDAHTYHDGKWVVIDADCAEAMSDIETLLEIKRRPRRG